MKSKSNLLIIVDSKSVALDTLSLIVYQYCFVTRDLLKNMICHEVETLKRF